MSLDQFGHAGGEVPQADEANFVGETHQCPGCTSANVGWGGAERAGQCADHNVGADRVTEPVIPETGRGQCTSPAQFLQGAGATAKQLVE